MKLITKLKRKLGCKSESSMLSVGDLESFLEKNGFNCIDTCDNEYVYDSKDVTIFFNIKDNTMDISFAHSKDGYYKMKNASSQQVKDVVILFKQANFISTN